MNDATAEALERSVAAVLRRYCAQNGMAVLADVDAVAARLREVVMEHGLPAPLAGGERGEPGEMSAEEVAPIIVRVLAGVVHADVLATPLRQLVKACLQPEFRTCRDSYREVGADGMCRRQQFGHARARVSGTHCVDCPYWIELTAEQHGKFLARQWRGASAGSGQPCPEDFEANREIFLPEDFRALRRLVRELAKAESVT